MIWDCSDRPSGQVPVDVYVMPMRSVCERSLGALGEDCLSEVEHPCVVAKNLGKART